MKLLTSIFIHTPIQMNVLGHQGTANQAFKDAAGFVDSQYVGAYELPASIQYSITVG
ncbi:MAG: hypothetical protein IPG55_05320 [Saprospiraceae bacterium]|nr:hypothetical protein [Candidatus Defluviibacterium haderslevense]